MRPPTLARLTAPLTAIGLLAASCGGAAPDALAPTRTPVAATAISTLASSATATPPAAPTGTESAAAATQAVPPTPTATPAAAASPPSPPPAPTAAPPTATQRGPSPPSPPEGERGRGEEAPAPTPGSVRLVPALGGRTFDRPVEIGAYPAGSDPAAMYVAEQDGRVLVFHDGAESLLLDIRSQVSRGGNEEGLLSVTPDPGFAANGHLWAYFSVQPGERRTRLARFTVDVAHDPYHADPATELVILEQPQPYSNHNGGAIRFGPDGMLYLGFGDGGSGGDPRGNGQNRGTWLGSIIRIDVRRASAAQPYAVPPDNPFVGVAGAKPEIWAYGVRNPWRMSFDPATGALWLGDVGQDRYEEVDVVTRGGNYGWNRLEGLACYRPASNCATPGAVAPVAVYPHGPGCSISGGVVLRGPTVPALAGQYLYSDFCSGEIWALDATRRAGPVRILTGAGNVSAFGTDAAGNVYVLAFGAPARRIVAN